MQLKKEEEEKKIKRIQEKVNKIVLKNILNLILIIILGNNRKK